MTLLEDLEWAEKHLSEGATLAGELVLGLVRRAKAELGAAVNDVEEALGVGSEAAEAPAAEPAMAEAPGPVEPSAGPDEGGV